MATGAAQLDGTRLKEKRKKRKCALTSTGLLMEGAEDIFGREQVGGIQGTSFDPGCFVK